MITVYSGPRVISPSLAGAVQTEALARQFDARPPPRRTLLLPAGAQPPAWKYLYWHREKILAY
jgi:hypothetical protein